MDSGAVVAVAILLGVAAVLAVRLILRSTARAVPVRSEAVRQFGVEAIRRRLESADEAPTDYLTASGTLEPVEPPGFAEQTVELSLSTPVYRAPVVDQGIDETPTLRFWVFAEFDDRPTTVRPILDAEWKDTLPPYGQVEARPYMAVVDLFGSQPQTAARGQDGEDPSTPTPQRGDPGGSRASASASASEDTYTPASGYPADYIPQQRRRHAREHIPVAVSPLQPVGAR